MTAAPIGSAGGRTVERNQGDPIPCVARRYSRREALATGLLAGAGLLMAGAAQSSAAGARTGDPGGSLITRPIPSTGERLPVIGLGTDRFRDSERTAIRNEIARMSRLGGKVIDTSADYGDSEALIGEALTSLGIRDRIFLATKLTAGGGFFGGIGGKASFDRSLKRLRTRHVDLLEVHNLDGVEQLLPMMRQWKQQALIRYLGVTTSSGGQHAELLDIMHRHRLDFIQVDYSIADRDAARAILPLAQERRIAVLVNVPFGYGSLFSRIGSQPLPAWAATIGVRSWAQFMLKYVISHPAVTCAIPGSTKVAHLEDNQAAARAPLPDEAMRRRMERYWDSHF